MTITPDQARELMENHVEPWEMPDLPDAVELWESAWDLALTVIDQAAEIKELEEALDNWEHGA